ncbi:peptidoglycan recognition protein [Streptomyces polyrhachis]|uniref:Peptidoglycan recognition protein n=1 Tax=Streptomyces polyrhachis TaxID=1282885 RepID=A0ABW2GGS5_9ACTN
MALGTALALAGVCALLLPGSAAERSGPRPSAKLPAALFYTAARPVVLPRSRWIRDAARDRPPARYSARVGAVFVHHTDSPNGYDCADAPRIIRSLYAGQTGNRGWDDVGYNFLVDRCGTIYEGRAGGTDRPVVGAHALGFNRGTTGIAALGTFTAGNPVPAAMERSIAALAAWKLGMSHTDPRARVRLVSTSDESLYPAGTPVTLPAVAGHDQGFGTSCPGKALSARLPAIRRAAARLQGRTAQALPPYSRPAVMAAPAPGRVAGPREERGSTVRFPYPGLAPQPLRRGWRPAGP